MDEVAGRPGGPTWTTYVDGEQVVLPASIDGVRAELPPEQRGEFDAAIGAAAAEDLHMVLWGWASRLRPEIEAANEAAFQRLEAGDFSGLTAEEDLDV
ncbi:hypothetical protein [Streptomyces mayteni]